LEMLAGKYPSEILRHLKARVSWDRVHDRLAALPGARISAVQSGGTIPDRGSYALVMPDRKTKVGELDEEFVFETRKGDTFLRDECALDEHSVAQVVGHVRGQLDAVGQIASDRCIVVELYDDALGDPRMVVHSPFGGRVNGPWAIALAGAIREKMGIEAQIN